MSTMGGGGGGGGRPPLGSSPKEAPKKRNTKWLPMERQLLCTYQCYPGGRGGGRGLGILIRHSSPREWLLTLWIRPRVRIFNFSLSLSGVGKFFVVVLIYSRKTGHELFCFKMAAIADVVQEEEICNLIKLIRSSIHPPLFLTSVRQLRCEV